MMKWIKGIALLMLIGFCLWLGARLPSIFSFQFGETKRTESKELVLEQVHKVFKLVTVEGQFSELYNASEIREHWFSAIAPVLYNKKVLIRVRARVLVGYDLEKLPFSINEADHTIILSQLPEPEILAIDHDLDYYDIRTGIFSAFSEEDLNRLNAEAKEFIREKALQGEMITAAKDQIDEVLNLSRYAAERHGWTLIIEGHDIPALKN